MSENENLRERTLAECCGIPREVLDYFHGDDLVFIIKNKRRIKILKKENDFEIILRKPSMIRDYSRKIGRIDSTYKVWNGGLYLNKEQFSKYIEKTIN